MEDRPARLFIIDAMAMAFRNFHAFGARPISNSKGLPTSAIFGCAQFLVKLIADEKPDYLVIATDTAEPTFRHHLYQPYKANRKEMPADLSVQIPHLFRMFSAMGCVLLKQSGVEADDLIGAIVSRYRGPKLDCFIVSGDKDFMQSIDDHTFLYVPQKGGDAKILGREGVREKFGCRPDQVIDVLALMGDSSDNVPGVRGIGEKGAAKLINTFGSLDNLYAKLEEVSNPKLRESLLAQKDMAFISRKLVTLDIDIPEIPPLHTLHFDDHRQLDKSDLLDFFKEMEFRRLTELIEARIEESKNQTSNASLRPLPPSQDSPSRYSVVSSVAEFDEFKKQLSAATVFSFDTESTGLDIISDQPIGMSFATHEGSAWYLPIHDKHRGNIPMESIRTFIRSLLSDPQKLLVAHNLKFDLQMMHNAGYEIRNKTADTMLSSYVLNSTARSHSLDHCCMEVFQFRKIPTTDLIGKHGEGSMLDVPLDQLGQYACEDADYTLRLHQHYDPLIDQEGLRKLYEDIEMPLVPVLAKMERLGVHVSRDTLSEISRDFTHQAQKLEASIHELAGESFNVNSPKQLQQIIFEKLKLHEQLGITRLKKTKSGYSTDVSVLEKMSDHPLARALLEYRSVSKLLNTYVDTLPTLIHPKTGRLHTSFHQTGTATGRLSSSNPNLQNIPIRTAMGRMIRKVFTAPSPDRKMISADYSQIELRILAHMAEDTGLIEAFRNNADIHTSTAAKIFGVDPTLVTKDMRGQAKAINFGIIYGMGPNRLAKETGVSYREAERFIAKYFESYPGIARYAKQAIASANKDQCTRTIYGRKRPFSEDEDLGGANPENIAVNSPIQGSAADLVKLAMIATEARLKTSGLDVDMLIQVHDELVFEASTKDCEAAVAIIRDAMQSALALIVPLAVDIGVGSNWLEAH